MKKALTTAGVESFLAPIVRKHWSSYHFKLGPTKITKLERALGVRVPAEIAKQGAAHCERTLALRQ